MIGSLLLNRTKYTELVVTKKAEEAASLQIKVTMCCHDDVQ